MRTLSRSGSTRFALAAGCLTLACVGAIEVAAAAGDGAAATATKPKSGKYKGEVGTFSVISFRTDGKRVKKLAAGVNAGCQDTFGTLTRFMEVAVNLSQERFKVKRSGRFKGDGQDENGTAWEVSGKFTSKRKAKGRFEASTFAFDPFTFTSELCAGSESWKAKR